jgi:hypothetical protein
MLIVPTRTPKRRAEAGASRKAHHARPGQSAAEAMWKPVAATPATPRSTMFVRVGRAAVREAATNAATEARSWNA